MAPVREWARRVWGTLRRNPGDQDLEEELRLRALRDQRGLPWPEAAAQDLRYAWRTCCTHPGFALAVVLSLSLGIGVNTALFSIIDVLMLRALPVSHPAELFLLRPDGPRAVPQFSYPQFQELRDATPPSGSVAAMSRVARMYGRVDGDSGRQLLTLQLVSGEYFPVLGLTSALGRLLTPDDNRTVGGHPVAVISGGLWHRLFAGAPDVVGRGITVNGTPLTIVGVAPAGFAGVWLESPVDIWLPLMMQANVQYAQNYYNNDGLREEPFAPQNQIRWLEVIGRSHSATMIDQGALGAAFQRDVTRDADAIGDATERRLFRQQRLVFEPFAQGLSNLRSRFGPPLFALLAMTGLILVVACANAANLLLARGEARRREIAVRLSIGASRGRVIRQLLTESTMLVMVATVCGIVSAAWTSDVLVRLALATTGPLPFTTHIDGRVLGFTLIAALLTVLLFGLAPAFRTTQVELGTALKTASTRRGSRLSLQQVLVVSQVALSLGVLVAAGLLAGTLRNYLQVNLGFAPEHVLSVWVSPRASGYQTDRSAELYRAVVERVQAVPGVRSASVAACGLAVGCNTNAGVEIEGYQPQPGERVRVQENEIGLNYFPTVGMRLMQGRDFTERDDERSPRVAIVNQAMARRYFQGRSPLGRRFGDGRGRFEVVGVVEDARVNRVQEPATPMAFYPIEQLVMYPAASLEVRVAGDPRAMFTEVGRAVAAAGLPVDRVSTPSRQIELNLAQETLVAHLASYFGALALALVCFGLFGTMAYVVSRRRTEFGIRLALGATRARLGLGVLRDSLGLVAIGLAAGIPAALGLSRVVAGLLFGIATTDLLTFVAAALLLALVATAAGLIPAWRAASVDPLVALRAE